MKEKSNIENKLFFSKYKPIRKLGEGSFGKIYLAINILTNENFALKLESKSSGENLLEQEAFILSYLKGDGIPSIKSFGFSGDNNVLVMELLGKSLEDLFQKQGGRFSLKTVCMLANQIISRLEYVHVKHILHRDIKPDNFLIGIEEKDLSVYIIDFGLSKKYRSSRTLKHIKFCNNKKLTGTARYASINALKGFEQGRRDDLEAVGYMLMYFLRGSLPWQGLKVDRREDRYKKIYEKKRSTTPDELCFGYPKEFVEYVTYTRNMEFEQEPDYEYLKGLFKKVMKDNNWQFDNEFDWITITVNNNNNSNHSKKPYNGYIKQFNNNNSNNDLGNNTQLNEHEINLKNNNEFKPNIHQILQTSANIETHANNLNTNSNVNNKIDSLNQNQIKVQDISGNPKEQVKTNNENGPCLIY